MPEIGAVAHFGILGGTGDFRKIRGEVTLVVISPELQEGIFDLEIDYSNPRKESRFSGPGGLSRESAVVPEGLTMVSITNSAVSREEVWRALRRTHEVRLRAITVLCC